MNKLKVGDIKKFNWNNEEFVAAVVNVTNEYVSLLNTDGYIKDFNRNNSETTYTATRLNPKIRESLEKMVDLYKKSKKLEKEIYEMKSLLSETHSNLIKEREKLQGLQGKFTFEKIGEVFLRHLSKANPNLTKKLKEKYQIDFSDTSSGTWLQFKRYEEIDKWVNPSYYSFLSRDYEENLRIREKNKEYYDLCDRYSKRDIKLELGNLKGTFKNEKSLKTGDKDSLYYCNSIAILFPQGCLNEDYVERLIKTLKVK